ncbi:MAG: hypothetical protein LWX07_08010, partial [Bacteroidetes bacterium]|nr:hypothetical protein [Bacteroidota bacterium]
LSLQKYVIRSVHQSGGSAILPFVPLYFRYITLLKLVIEISEEGGDDIDPDLFQIIIDPYSYFSRNVKINNILVISDDNEDGEDTNQPSDINPESPFEFRKSKSPYERNNIPKEIGEDLRNKLAFCPNRIKIFCGGLWEFFFHQKNDVSETTVTEFLNEINQVFNLEDGNKFDPHKMISIDELRNYLKELKGNTKKLKTIHDDFDIDINDYSLTLFHKSISRKGFDVLIRHYCRCPILSHEYFGTNLTGTYLTGDCNLNNINFPKYIVANIDKVVVFQVPHHGSKNNWDQTKLNRLMECYNFVINFGYGNKYKHPSSDVIEEILDEYWVMPILNTQFEDFNYKFIELP